MLLVTAVVEVITDEVKQSVASIRLFVRLFLLSFEPIDLWSWVFLYMHGIMILARLGLKMKVVHEELAIGLSIDWRP